MQMSQVPSNSMSGVPVHYCGECNMPIDYCIYNDNEQPQRCLQWLERNLPEVFAQLPSNNDGCSVCNTQCKAIIQREPVMVVSDFSAVIRDGRFASVGSIDELKKYIVKSKVIKE